MPQIPVPKRPARRKIDFDRIGNKILVLLYQRYMESNAIFVPFNDIAAAISSEPRNAIRDELENLEDGSKVDQKTETRFSGLGVLAGLQGNRSETYQTKVDGYKITRVGIDLVNKLSDEIYEVLSSEIVAVQENTPAKTSAEIWEPLPLDRQSTEFSKAIEATEIALKEVESSNGYADTNPEERNSIVETIKSNLKALKEGVISRGQIIEGMIKPFRFIAAKFADASMGELAKRC